MVYTASLFSRGCRFGCIRIVYKRRWSCMRRCGFFGMVRCSPSVVSGTGFSRMTASGFGVSAGANEAAYGVRVGVVSGSSFCGKPDNSNAAEYGSSTTIGVRVNVVSERQYCGNSTYGYTYPWNAGLAEGVRPHIPANRARPIIAGKALERRRPCCT